jgi:hypothetical protein
MWGDTEKFEVETPWIEIIQRNGVSIYERDRQQETQ